MIFFYHRKFSPQYKVYLEGCGVSIFPSKKSSNFLWGKRIFGIPSLWMFNSERTDEEPDIEKLKKESGAKHGIVFWVPYRSNLEVPKNWKKVWFPSHFQETGFSIVTENYEKNWSTRARRAKKKYLASGAEIREVDRETFITAFRKARFLPTMKGAYVRYYAKLTEIDPTSVRQWLAYSPAGKPIAGLAVHDFLGDQSVHMVAFTTREAYPYQVGTGLIDRWFADSLTRGIHYISFDQLRQKYGPIDQRGYSRFKENFIDYRMSFPNSYFRTF